jgi:hypothetical protein
MNNQQPGEFDAVLGGNNPSMEGIAILGGIEGVKLRLQIPDSTVKIAAMKLLTSALLQDPRLLRE